MYATFAFLGNGVYESCRLFAWTGVAKLRLFEPSTHRGAQLRHSKAFETALAAEQSNLQGGDPLAIDWSWGKYAALRLPPSRTTLRNSR